MHQAPTTGGDLVRLAERLRSALSSETPAWILEAAHRDITELERLALFSAGERERLVAYRRASTLLQILGETKRHLANHG